MRKGSKNLPSFHSGSLFTLICQQTYTEVPIFLFAGAAQMPKSLQISLQAHPSQTWHLCWPLKSPNVTPFTHLKETSLH